MKKNKPKWEVIWKVGKTLKTKDFNTENRALKFAWDLPNMFKIVRTKV